jgi:hypothetical protein
MNLWVGPAIYREWPIDLDGTIDLDGNKLPPSKDWLPDREEPRIMASKSLRRPRRFEPPIAPASRIDIAAVYVTAGGKLQ